MICSSISLIYNMWSTGWWWSIDAEKIMGITTIMLTNWWGKSQTFQTPCNNSIWQWPKTLGQTRCQQRQKNKWHHCPNWQQYELTTTWDLFIIVLFEEHEEWVFHEIIIDDHLTLNSFLLSKTREPRLGFMAILLWFSN